MTSSKGPRRSLSERLDMLLAGYPLKMIDPSLDPIPNELPEDDLDDDPYLKYDDYLDRDIHLSGPMVDVPLGSVSECQSILWSLMVQNEILWEFPGSRTSLRPSNMRGITPELVTVFVVLDGPVAKPIWKALAWMMCIPPNPEDFFLGRGGRGRPADIRRKVMVWFYDGRDLEERGAKPAPHALAKRIEKLFGPEKSLSRQNIRTWRERPGYENSVRAIYRLLKRVSEDERNIAQTLTERTLWLGPWQK
jgi:hypothetical protein